jgi:hypothetical protein
VGMMGAARTVRHFVRGVYGVDCTLRRTRRHTTPDASLHRVGGGVGEPGQLAHIHLLRSLSNLIHTNNSLHKLSREHVCERSTKSSVRRESHNDGRFPPSSITLYA